LPFVLSIGLDNKVNYSIDLNKSIDMDESINNVKIKISSTIIHKNYVGYNQSNYPNYFKNIEQSINLSDFIKNNIFEIYKPSIINCIKNKISF
jgi:hypothetical protein